MKNYYLSHSVQFISLYLVVNVWKENIDVEVNQILFSRILYVSLINLIVHHT